MKIAFIHPSNPFEDNTGATYSANKLVEGLKSDHEITVYCTNSTDKKSKEYNLENFLEEDSRGSSTAQLNREIVEKKEELAEFDIIYSYPMKTILGLGKISSKIDAKTVVTLNAYGAICPTNTLMYRKSHRKTGSSKCIKCILKQQKTRISGGGLKYLKEFPVDLARKTLKLNRTRKTRKYIDDIDQFIALTDHVKERYIEAGFPEQSIEVIPPILDENFLIEHKSNFENPYNLLYVGYLKNHKGVDRLVPIIEELNQKSEKEFHLTIIGDGPFRNKIEKQIKKSPEKDKIDFKGLVPNKELPDIYASHDLFLYPGKWEEPFGRIFIESLAAGTPVISTPKGIAQEQEGIIETELSEFSDEILRLFDEEEIEKISENCDNYVKRYESSKILDRIEEIIR